GLRSDGRRRPRRRSLQPVREVLAVMLLAVPDPGELERCLGPVAPALRQGDCAGHVGAAWRLLREFHGPSSPCRRPDRHRLGSGRRTAMPRTLVGALMLSLFVSSARDALAQSDKKLEVRAFAPPEYRVELRVDVGRLVESGVWDLAERS